MKESIDLTRLWAQTNGIRVESLSPTSELFIFLRVDSVEMPASYLTPDPWFLMCRRLGDGVWEVGLRAEHMRYITGPNEKPAVDIFNNLRLMAHSNPAEAKEWFPAVMNAVIPEPQEEENSMDFDVFVENQDFVPKI